MSFFVILVRLASIRGVVLAFTANKQTNTLNYIIAERRERSERSEANNRVLFEIPRYLYIYIYNLCLSASALCKTVHTLRKSYHVGHCAFGTQAAVRRTTKRSRPFVRNGRRRQFS